MKWIKNLFTKNQRHASNEDILWHYDEYKSGKRQ